MESRVPSLEMSSAMASHIRQGASSQGFSNGYDRDLYGIYRQGSENVIEFAGFQHRFDKTALLDAQVIQQVDRKFVACLMKDSNGQSGSDSRGQALVLIDQHAADERIRVERFLKELCLGFRSQTATADVVKGVKRKELSPPVPVLLTRHEARLLVDPNIQWSFEIWGLQFEDLNQNNDDESENKDGYLQVLVSSVPDVVSEKVCCIMLVCHRFLISLLNSFC
jgi:DNA mismatch repair protein MLH3